MLTKIPRWLQQAFTFSPIFFVRTQDFNNTVIL